MSSFEQFQKMFVSQTVDNIKEQSLISDVVPAGKLSNQEAALEVHRDGYFARLTEALGEHYESIWWFLGDEEFFKLSRDYIQAHPSSEDNLNNYGLNMVSYLKSQQSSLPFPFLSQLAEFEQAFTRLFHQPPNEPLKAELIQGNEKSFEAKWTFVPLDLLSFNYDIYSLWTLRNKEQSEVEEIDDQEKPYWFILYKYKQNVHVLELSEDVYFTLKAIMQSKRVSMESILGELEELGTFTAETISSTFSIILSAGLVAEISF